ncbi:MAG: branched-chain amino acid ABC transporter permease [Thermomicrobiales bacterium]
MEFNHDLFIQILISGVASGALIALIALGYTLVYGIVELINFAHGEVFMMGAFFAISIVSISGITNKSAGPAILGIAFIAFVGAMIFSATLNFSIDRLAYRRLRNAPRLAPLITAIGISFILQNLGIYWKGSNQFSPPPLIPIKYRTYNVLNEWFGLNTRVRVRPLDLAVIGVTIPLLAALSWFVYRTKTGKAMRATAQDREASALMGIDVNRTIAVAFIIGGALAGAGGMIAAYYNNIAWFRMGFRYGLFAFTAAVLGGIGNMYGAVVAGIMIGIIWQMSAGFVGQYVHGWGDQWTTTVIFGILVLVMIFRPTGLFGEKFADKV